MQPFIETAAASAATLQRTGRVIGRTGGLPEDAARGTRGREIPA
jgi:hypothetical protein